MASWGQGCIGGTLGLKGIAAGLSWGYICLVSSTLILPMLFLGVKYIVKQAWARTPGSCSLVLPRHLLVIIINNLEKFISVSKPSTPILLEISSRTFILLHKCSSIRLSPALLYPTPGFYSLSSKPQPSKVSLSHVLFHSSYLSLSNL